MSSAASQAPPATAPPVRQRPTTPDSVGQRRTAPRARTARVDVRIGAGGLAAVDQRAGEDGRTRSDWTRLALAYAVTHMPRGWRP